ncbi:serine hydrolase domain-containing protein [Estrella lausannensis]|uniref:Beta-lactamase n=1 Tax=Estrella lausannensis TaxID=483423 RepID=A0A0H5E3Z2_9BACT|nr:serine hydrolase domain-containing protein [Estrella lausannensis]CRX37935.1 beta-lactamase [Estrella lausannensis]
MKALILTLGLLAGSLTLTDEDQTAKRRGVEQGLRQKVLITGHPAEKMDLVKRMEYYKVPGVSIAVINEGKIEWTQGYGRFGVEPDSPLVTTQTLFQAGSISKPLTAFGALLLVEQGKLSLDDDVNRYLKKWQVPENEFTSTEKVTLRRLLSHTAGTNVSGFPGYSIKDQLPTTLEVLEGKKPLVNTEPVTVIAKPGSALRYSGGGTTIVQLLIEEITGEKFELWMQTHVLRPLGMVESTFKQPLPLADARYAAYGHHLGGVKVEGNWHLYPEMGAAGLWTTSRDLARFVTYIQTVLNGRPGPLLSESTITTMLQRQRAGGQETDAGLGFFLQNYGKDLIFAHGGQDAGFIARLYAYAYQGKGVVILMNNDAGWPLMEEITNSIADSYQWPNNEPIEKKTTPLDFLRLNELTGKYTSKEGTIEIKTLGTELYIDMNNGVAPLRLRHFGNCVFFIQEDDVNVDFHGCEGQPQILTITDPKGNKTVYNKICIRRGGFGSFSPRLLPLYQNCLKIWV